MRLATPFEAPAPLQAWPLPARIGVDVDARAWRAAVDWGGFIDREQSRAALGTAAGLMDIAAPIGSSSELGAIVATPIALAALGAAMVGAAHAANEAGQQARYERRFASCVERLGAQFAPEVVRPAVEAALAAAPAAGAPARAVRSGMSTAPWQVSLTRVVFRRCADSKRYGVDVATRWRAPGLRADLLSRPRGAVPDPALAWSEPAPWEIVVDGDAPCRSFEAYCEAGNEGLVTQDIVTAVQAARDAILAAPAAPAADRGGRPPPRGR